MKLLATVAFFVGAAMGRPAGPQLPVPHFSSDCVVNVDVDQAITPAENFRGGSCATVTLFSRDMGKALNIKPTYASKAVQSASSSTKDGTDATPFASSSMYATTGETQLVHLNEPYTYEGVSGYSAQVKVRPTEKDTTFQFHWDTVV